MDIPTKCELGNTIFKKLFYENSKLNKRIKNFSPIILLKLNGILLKTENINIKPFKDEIKEYSEVEFFSVIIKSPEKTNRLSEIIMRSIPYPLVLIFQNTIKYKFLLLIKG